MSTPKQSSSSPIPDPGETHDDVPRSALLSVRFVLPATILLLALIAGLVWSWLLALGLVFAAVFVVVADWLIRFAIVSQDDREREQGARRRFRRTGRWPRQGP